MQEKEHTGLLGALKRGLKELTRVEVVYVSEGEVVEEQARKSARGFNMDWIRKNGQAKKLLEAELPNWKDFVDNGEVLGMAKGQTSPEARANRSMAKASALDLRRQLYQIYLEERS